MKKKTLDLRIKDDPKIWAKMPRKADDAFDYLHRHLIEDNEKIMAIAVVNGGEMRGRMIAPSSKRIQAFERFVRTAVKAKRKPRIVPQSPTREANRRLFQRA